MDVISDLPDNLIESILMKLPLRDALGESTVKKLCNRREMDVISDLPDNMIESILMKLPLRDALGESTVKKLCNRREMDVISDLPDNMIETILMKLPLRDAARTCILSRRWRYSWVKLPRLKLYETFWQESLQNQSQGRAAKFESILFRILLLHQGPITDITLHIPKLESPPKIDTFVTSIVRNGVQRFSLYNVRGGHCKLHSSLFTCPTLNYLDLRSCEVNFLPSTFERFNNLIMMTLVNVTISAQALKSLVSSCPSLHTLQLGLSIDIQCLEIIAPKLVHFLYCHASSSLSSPALNYGQQKQPILRLLGGFPELECLSLDGHCVKSLAVGGFPTRLPTSMLHFLNFIDLACMCLEDVDQFSFVLCLMRSSPNLQTLKVNNSKNRNMEHLQEEVDFSNLTLNHLLEVDMLSVVGGRLELKFIRMLLEKSPSLRKMSIGLDTSKIADKGLKIIKEMFMFPRAAPNVEVHIKD